LATDEEAYPTQPPPQVPTVTFVQTEVNTPLLIIINTSIPTET